MGVMSTASTIATMTANDYKNAQAIYANMQNQALAAQNGGMGVLTQQALKAANAQNMELLNQQLSQQSLQASTASSSLDSISSSFSDQIQQLTSSSLSVTDQISQITSASGLSASSAAGFSTSTDFTQAIIDSISSASKSSSSSSTNSDVMTSATNMLKTYFKQFCPGMSDEQISTICKFAASQYGDLAKAMDMSSLTSSVMGSSSTGSTGSTSSVGNNGNYGANKGVSGLLADAGAMVGMTEQSNAASINKITKKSGINCQTTPWCAAWAMNMLKDHGVLDTSSCSNVNYCPTIVNWAKKENIWAGRGSYTPQAGDAILFDWQGDGTSDHIGIVEKVENGKVYTIEGNSSDSVARRSYSLSSSKVMGYINCAAQK